MFCPTVLQFFDDEQDPTIKPPLWSILVYNETLRQRFGLVVEIGIED